MKLNNDWLRVIDNLLIIAFVIAVAVSVKIS